MDELTKRVFFSRAAATPLGPTTPMRIGSALHSLLSPAQESFPKYNSPSGSFFKRFYGVSPSFIEPLIFGDSVGITDRMAEGYPHQLTGRGPNEPNIKPGPTGDLVGALPVGTAAKVAKLAPLVAGGVLASKVFSPLGQGTLGATIMGVPPMGLKKTVKEGKQYHRPARPATGESRSRKDRNLLKQLGTNLEGKPLYYKGDQWLSEGKDIGESIVMGASIKIDPTVEGVRSAAMSVGKQVTDPGEIRKLLKPTVSKNKISINLRKGALPGGRPVISVDTIPKKGDKPTHFYALNVEMGGETYLRKTQKGGNPRMFADQYGDVYIDPSQNNIATYIPYKGKGVPTQANIKKVGEQYLLPVYEQLYTSGQNLAK